VRAGLSRSRATNAHRRTRTTRIILLFIIILYCGKKTPRDVRRPRSRRSESEPVVPLGDRSINQPSPPPPPPCVERGSRARDDPVCCFVSAPGRRRPLADILLYCHGANGEYYQKIIIIKHIII